MKTDKKLQRDWIHALESGKYTQGRGALNNSQGYCCLGVACCVSKKGRWASTPDATCKIYKGKSFNLSHSLDESLSNLFGLDEGLKGQLISANDGCDGQVGYGEEQNIYSFEEIASVLRMEFDIWD